MLNQLWWMCNLPILCTINSDDCATFPLIVQLWWLCILPVKCTMNYEYSATSLFDAQSTLIRLRKYFFPFKSEFAKTSINCGTRVFFHMIYGAIDSSIQMEEHVSFRFLKKSMFLELWVSKNMVLPRVVKQFFWNKLRKNVSNVAILYNNVG